MPFVNIKLIEGVFSTEQKKEMVQRLTDTMSPSKAKTCAASPGWSSKKSSPGTGASAANR
jgi:hypothetical protein